MVLVQIRAPKTVPPAPEGLMEHTPVPIDPNDGPLPYRAHRQHPCRAQDLGPRVVAVIHRTGPLYQSEGSVLQLGRNDCDVVEVGMEPSRLLGLARLHPRLDVRELAAGEPANRIKVVAVDLSQHAVTLGGLPGPRGRKSGTAGRRTDEDGLADGSLFDERAGFDELRV